jgi:hypothetical protein
MIATPMLRARGCPRIAASGATTTADQSRLETERQQQLL